MLNNFFLSVHVPASLARADSITTIYVHVPASLARADSITTIPLAYVLHNAWYVPNHWYFVPLAVLAGRDSRNQPNIKEQFKDMSITTCQTNDDQSTAN